MTLLKLVLSLTLLCKVTGFPSLDRSVFDWSDTGMPGTGKNALTPYVSLLASVIPSAEAASSIPTEAGKAIRDARSSDLTNISRQGSQRQAYNPPCPSGLRNKHLGQKTPLIRPTSGSIFKDKSHGDGERYAVHLAGRTAVSAHSSTQRKGGVVTVSNPTSQGRQQPAWSPRQLNVCSSVWPAPANAATQRQRSQNTTKEDEYLLEYYLTYQVPTSTTPMTPTRPSPVRPTAEPVVSECRLPPPYQDKRYDWLEVLAAYGGLPGCVNVTQLAPETPAAVESDTCERPLRANFSGQDVYQYVQSDLHNFFREETAKLMFPGRPNQFLEVRGLLVWTSPPDDGNVYVLTYIFDDTGLWLFLPDQTCKFENTATLTCTTRQHCWCQDGKETCLGFQALPGNLLATLVGGG